MVDIHRGLADVAIDTSQVCHIDGERGELIYRGYDIRELADKASYEEVVYLLWNDDLPTTSQLADFRAELATSFMVPAAVFEGLELFSHATAPMHALRTAISHLGALDALADGVDDANVRRIGMRLVAQLPTVVAAYQRVRSGLEPVAPRPDLSVAGNFLYMLSGEVPTEAATRVMDVALVLHAEHGSNASTFVARAVASTLSDVYSSITAAIGSLKGPLHGGANEAVMKALEQMGEMAAVEPYVLGVLAKPGGRVMGFGHRVYRVLDPRAMVLKDVAEKLAAESGYSLYFEMSLEMERVMEREMSARGKQVRPNVDFFSASVYRMLGLPTDMYTPVFAVARISGWMAHLYEQYADNRLMRPRLVYEGPVGRKFQPVEAR
ncbi:MAG TPA: citrate/2-methylcitrate synthase [Trueperaceae bacterium]|nr:citrate/2-methylcitrate synthase [Trueperaceae bacterium]